MEEHHAVMASSFAARVTQMNRESLTRQVREGVLIRRTSKDIMNSKFEWFNHLLMRSGARRSGSRTCGHG